RATRRRSGSGARLRLVTPFDPARPQDERAERPVTATEIVLTGRVWNVRRDVVEFADGTSAREYVEHPGAVVVLAVNDRDDIYVLRQYRHPARAELIELPAGLLDVAGEDPAD